MLHEHIRFEATDIERAELEALHQVYLGINFNLPHNDRFYESIAAADRAMYAAKNDGRNTWRMASQANGSDAT